MDWIRVDMGSSRDKLLHKVVQMSADGYLEEMKALGIKWLH